MMRRRLGLFIVMALLTLAPSVAPAASLGLADRVVERRLKNGVTVLIVERHQVPTTSFYITYGVGSVNESRGLTGLAHFFEHMLFKGTRTIGTRDFERERVLLDELDRLDALTRAERAKAHGNPAALASLTRRFDEVQREADRLVVTNEIGELYERHGGVGLNAATAKDFTRYFVSLPANRLPLWAAVESERMADPVLREFYKEREVVIEERRLRYENQPQGRLFEAFLSAAFVAHPYGQPGIGWTSDIRALTRTQVADFFQTYYTPANAVIAIVGDVRPREVMAVLDETFGQIPARDSPPLVVTEEPDQAGERRVEVEFDAEPQVVIGYRKGAITDADEPVFAVIDSILSEGRTSRLYKRLVKERQLAVSVSTGTGEPGDRFPNLFTISAVPRAPHVTAELEAAIYEELERLKTEPVDRRELRKVLTQLDASILRTLRSNSGLASALGYYHVVAGTWRYLLTLRDEIAKVKAEDIKRVASTHFVKRHRVVATLVKKGT